MSTQGDDDRMYVGDVRAVLGAEALSRDQMQQIYVFVRRQAGRNVPMGKWMQWDYTDIACAAEVLRLAAVREVAGTRTVRLHLHRLRKACEHLRRQGLSNPLLQASLELDGADIINNLGDCIVDASNNQLLLDRATDRVQRMTSLHLREDLLQKLTAARDAAASVDFASQG